MQEQKEAPQETEDEPKKSLFIIKSDKYGLINAENYLKNRDWELGSSDDLRQAMVFILNKKPTYVMVTVDHSNSKVDQLPKLLMQTFPVKVIVFAESHSSKSLHKLRSMDHPYTLMPPISGPMIERMVHKINLDEERKKNQSPEDEKKRNSYYNQSDSDVISIKNSNKDNGNYHQRFGSDKGDNSKVIINQDKQNQGNAHIAQDAKKSDSRGNSSFSEDSDHKSNYNHQNSKDKQRSSDYSQNSEQSKQTGSYSQSKSEKENSHKSQKANDKTANTLSSNKDNDSNKNSHALTKDKDKKDSSRTDQDKATSKDNSLSQKTSKKKNKNNLSSSDKKSSSDSSINEASKSDKNKSASSKKKKENSQNTQSKNQNRWEALEAKESGAKDKNSKKNKTKNNSDESSNSLENPFSRQRDNNNTKTSARKDKNQNGASSDKKSNNKNNGIINKNERKGTDVLNQNNNSSANKNNQLSNFKKNKKGAGLYKSVLEQATQEALNSSTEFGNNTNVAPLDENSNFSCISVNSQRYNGYLLAAGSSDNHLDDEFIKKIKTRVMDFLESKGEHIYDQNDLDINVHKINYSEWGEEEAEFFRRSIHQGEEIGMAFFESQEVKHPLFIRESEDMLCLSIDSIFEDLPIEFDLYIYLARNDKYIKITKQGGKLFSNQKQKLLSSGFKEMHVPASQKQNLVKYRAQNFLNENIKNYLKKKKSS
ncbi:MAG: hypothetical protein MK008_02520 [Bdellovibrionales bacterium]|nr:hypothetical protein [Bdellovibrionales bacterium]